MDIENETKKEVLKEARRNFKIEFLNRIDEIVVFQKLNNSELKQISENMLFSVSKRMLKKNIKIEFDSNVSEFIISQIKDNDMGARPIRRLIQDLIENEIAENYLDGKITEGDKIKVFVKDEKACILNESKTIMNSKVYNALDV